MLHLLVTKKSDSGDYIIVTQYGDSQNVNTKIQSLSQNGTYSGRGIVSYYQTENATSSEDEAAFPVESGSHLEGERRDSGFSATNNDTPQTANVNPRRNARAATMFLNGQTVIALFQDANRSSFLHEMGHFFLESRRRVSLVDDIPQQVKNDWQTITKWLELENIDFSAPLSAKDTERWRNAHEKWAAGFEQYLMEGKAPSAELAHAFEDFKEWLSDIYQTVKNIFYIDTHGKACSVEINNDIREVMGRILANAQEEKIEEHPIPPHNMADNEKYKEPALRTSARGRRKNRCAGCER
jgi:hypothetical protein